MLLLPLLLLWARTPMYFSRYLMACLIPTTTLIAVLTPLFVGTLDGSVLAADRFGDDTEQHSAAGQSRSDFDSPDSRSPVLTHHNSLRHQLREGTVIPQITGQISMSGRRWLFTPSDQNGGETQSPDNRLRKTETHLRESVENNAISRVFTTSIETYEQETKTLQPSKQSKSLEIVENLVLQRVVNAIRADANDSQWTITARVTEFFDENRL
ncbi:signal peptide protein, partial [Rhodopirellula maiorica SM1]